MEKLMQDIHQKLQKFQKDILKMRMDIPIDARTSHTQLRYMEHSLSTAVESSLSAMTCLKSECPTLLQITENK